MRSGRWNALMALCVCALLPSPAISAPPEIGAPDGSVATAAIGPRSDRYELPIGRYTVDERPILELIGQVQWRAFRLDDREVTVEAVVEGYRQQTFGDGREILLDCRNRDCGGFDFRFGVSLMPAPAMRMDVQDFAQLSIRQAKPEAYLSILISRVSK